MTDDDIIKAMQCVIGNSVNCSECTYQKVLPFPSCTRMCAKDALDLINRQKAEIERLKRDIAIHKHVHEESNAAYQILVKQAKNQAIHEFVKKFKDRVVNKYEYVQVDIFDELDNFTKEMTG